MPSTDVLKEFERHLKAHDRAAKTVKDYVDDLRLFAEWFTHTRDERFTASAITPTDIRDYRAYLLHTKRQAPATINRRLTVLRVFCRWAMNRGLIATDPTVAIKPVKQVVSAPRWLDRREQHALLHAAEKDGDARNLALIVLMLNTGLRVSEVAGLTLDDVEMGERKGQVTVRGKGDKVRVVPLNAEARRALRAYLAVRPQVKHCALFVNQKGEPLGRLGIEYQVATLARLAKLEDVTPHTLRHTFAKNLVDQGVSLDQVATLLGHRSLTATARYTRPSPQDLARAVERLEE